jgi:hypothetical protein
MCSGLDNILQGQRSASSFLASLKANNFDGILIVTATFILIIKTKKSELKEFSIVIWKQKDIHF